MLPLGNVLLSGEGHAPRTDKDAADSPLGPPLSSLVPKITDFGLAKRVEAGSGMTATGAILDTHCEPDADGDAGSRVRW